MSVCLFIINLKLHSAPKIPEVHIHKNFALCINSRSSHSQELCTYALWLKYLPPKGTLYQ